MSRHAGQELALTIKQSFLFGGDEGDENMVQQVRT